MTVPTLSASHVFLTTPTLTGQLSSALTATDFSVNDGTQGGNTNQVIAFDGLLVQAMNAYANNNATVTKLAGAGLTSSGRGSVVEIDAIFTTMWNNYRTTPDVIFVNAQELVNITKACLSNASGPLLRYEVNADGDHYDLTAAGTVSFYYNPFIPGGGRKIPIMVHPTIPPGTILMYADRLPPYFKTNNTPAVAEVLCRRDYYSIDWAQRTREYEFGVYSEEVLAVYAPFCLSVLTGVGNAVIASS